MKAMWLHLACNDHRNGSFEGKFGAVAVEGDALELQCSRWGWSPSLRVESDRIRISRRWFPVLGHRTWVGNWCWDAFAVTPDTLAAVLNYVRSTGWFSCDGGLVELGDVWDDPLRRFTGALLRDSTQPHGTSGR